VLFISHGGGVSSKLLPKPGQVPWRGTRAATHRRVLALHAKLREAKAAEAAAKAGEAGEAPPPEPQPDRLLAASEGVRQVTVLPPSKASVMQIIKHHTLVISMEALTELHQRLTHERAVGFISRLGEEGEAARDVRTVLAYAQQAAAAAQQQQQEEP
jgi:hypothetical protein